MSVSSLCFSSNTAIDCIPSIDVAGDSRLECVGLLGWEVGGEDDEDDEDEGKPMGTAVDEFGGMAAVGEVDWMWTVLCVASPGCTVTGTRLVWAECGLKPGMGCGCPYKGCCCVGCGCCCMLLRGAAACSVGTCW